MNCNLPLASVSLLQEKGIIDQNNVLSATDIPAFNKENLRQQQSAKQHYGYTGDELPFKYIAAVVNNEPAYLVVLNEKFIKAVEQLDRVSDAIKPGVAELFESNPEFANNIYYWSGISREVEDRNLAARKAKYSAQNKIMEAKVKSFANGRGLSKSIEELKKINTPKSNVLSLLIATEQANIKAKQFDTRTEEGKANSKKQYDIKNKLLDNIFEQYIQNGWDVKYEPSTIPGIRHTLFFTIPDTDIQLSYHGNYEKIENQFTNLPKGKWDGIPGATFHKLEEATLNIIGEENNDKTNWREGIDLGQEFKQEKFVPNEEQKQQALQLYSSYLDTIFPETLGFETTSVDLTPSELTSKPIGSPLDQSEGTGICDGTCGLMANRLQQAGMPYGHTQIEDKVANYHAVALTEIDGKRYILNQPQHEFLSIEYQKAPLWERAMFWRGMSQRFNRHLPRVLNDLYFSEGINPYPALFGTIESEYFGEIGPIFKDKKIIKREGYSVVTGTLIENPSVRIAIKLEEGETLENINPEEADVQTTKDGEKVPVWTKTEFTPRFIEVTKENLIKEYQLTNEQADASIKAINKAIINPGTKTQITPRKQDIEGFKSFVTQRQGETFFQVESTGKVATVRQSTASEEALNKVKELLAKLGVQVTPDFTLEGTSIAGLARTLNDIYNIVYGEVRYAPSKENRVLVEEAFHIIEAMLPQELRMALLDEITNYRIYQETLEVYKYITEYQLADGTPNIPKIKREAVGKLLAEYYIGMYDSKTVNNQRLGNIFNKIWEWLKSLVSKDIYKQTIQDLLDEQFNLNSLEMQEDFLQVDPQYVSDVEKSFTPQMEAQLKEVSLKIQPILKKMEFSLSKVGPGAEWLRTIHDAIKEGHLNALADHLSKVLNYMDDLERFTTDLEKFAMKMTDPIKLGAVDAQGRALNDWTKKLSQEKKAALIKDYHFLNNVINHIGNIIEEYKTVLKTERLPSNDWLKGTITAIDKNLLSVSNIINKGGVQQVIASILEDKLSESMKSITQEYNERLDWVYNELDKLNLIQQRRELTDKEKKSRFYLQKIEADIIKKRDKVLPTRENILKALTDNSDPRSPFYAMVQFFMRTDEFQSEALTAAISTFIKDELRNVKSERDNIASEMRVILDELEKERGMIEDPDVFYKGFFREVTVKKFVERVITDKDGKTSNVGELIEYPAKVLNGDFDNIRFNNEIETLKYKIYEEESKPLSDLDLVEDLKKQLEDLLMLAERQYTPEYYAIMQILTDEDRHIIESLYQERNMLEKFGNYENIDEESLLRIEEIDREIARLSSLTDLQGEPLPEGPERDRALRFKAYREAVQENEVYIYETSEDATEQFKARKKVVDARYKEAEAKFVRKEITTEEYDAEVKIRDDWYYFNSRITINQDWYIQRQEIFDEIDALLRPYMGTSKEAIGDLYAEMFNMLRGFRDPNGVYLAEQMSPELRAKVKEIQLKINDLRELPDLPEDVEEEKEILFEELADLQRNVNTVYWDLAIEDKIQEEIDILESEFIAQFRGTQEEINQEAGRRRKLFKAQAEKIVKESQWYEDNTIEVTYKNSKGEEVIKRIPILVWRQTLPRDPSFMMTEPSKAYATRHVNPKYDNPNYNDSIPYKTTTNPAYQNTDLDYQALNSKEKDILKRYRDTYFEYQKNNPYTGRLGEVVPYVHKSGLDLTIDWTKSITDLLFRKPEKLKGKLARTIDPLKIFWRRHISMKDDDEEIEGSVKERDYKDRRQEYYKNSIYIPYTTPFKYMTEISSDITESIAAYGMESIKTQMLIQLNPIAASVGEMVSKNPQANRGLKKTIEHTYRKEFLSEKSVLREGSFGNTKAAKRINSFVKGLQKTIISRMGFVRKNVMAFNLSSETANAANNIYQILVNAGIYNVSPKDITQAMRLAGVKMTTDRGDILSVGNSKEVIRALRYFGSVGQDEVTAHLAGRIRTSFLRKWSTTDTIYRSREMAETFFSVVMMYAMGKHTLVELNGRYVPIYEAYEIRDNKYVPKKGAIIPENVLTTFRRNLNKISVDLRGAYGTNAPHASKFFFGKMVLFLKGFFIPQLFRRWVTDVNYGTGTVNYATALTFYRELINMWRYRHFAEYEMTDAQKRAFRTGMKEHIWYLANYLLLSFYFSTRGGGDDNKEDSYLIYLWKRIFGETDTFSPAAPVNYVLSRIHEPQRSGSSTTGSSFSDAAYNFVTKNFEDFLVSPITGRRGVEGLGLLLDAPNWGDPYYGHYYTRGHGPDSDDPEYDVERAKAMSPFEAGKPRLVIGLMKFFNQSAPLVLYPEQANKYYNLYNYNIYMLPSEPLFIKKKKKKD